MRPAIVTRPSIADHVHGMANVRVTFDLSVVYLTTDAMPSDSKTGTISFRNLVAELRLKAMVICIARCRAVLYRSCGDPKIDSEPGPLNDRKTTTGQFVMTP
jgi:hypothetical protein